MPIPMFLAASSATPEFKADLSGFLSGVAPKRILVSRANPRVKVLRVLTQLLANHPDLPVATVQIDARSGCSDYSGVLTAELADGSRREFEFTWDCRWRAEAEGWVDYYGFPDQIRAADEFGWRCFAVWQERGPVAKPALTALVATAS